MSSTVGAVFLSLSNLSFLLPFAEAIRREKWTLAFIYVVLVFASGIYHLCYSTVAWCIFDHATHQNLDFFLSYLLIPLSALYFIDFSPTPKGVFVQRWLMLSFALAIYLLLSQRGSIPAGTIEYALVGSSVLIVLLYWGLCGLRGFQWGYVALSLFLILGSFVFFIWPDILGYDASHSIWHVMAALGQFFLLQIKDTHQETQHYVALESPLIFSIPSYLTK